MAHHSFLCRNKVIGCSWLQRVTSRQHGRGHGTLVSHSTDVGCISKETEVKKLLLAGTTVLLMATSAAAAQATVWVPGSPAWNARLACARQVYRAQIQAGDPRWQRQAARRRAGVPTNIAVLHTRDGQSITRSA